jgi:hypothetical protein
LTVCPSFDVISFANPSLFCIGKADRDAMKMNREFSFAVIVTIYTIWLPRRRAITLTPQRLNEAHPNITSGSFLNCRLNLGRQGVR